MKRYQRIQFTAMVLVISSLLCGYASADQARFNLFFRQPVHGSGVVMQEPRVVHGITGIEMKTVGDVIIELGDTETLLLTADDNLLPLIDTVVDGGILTIRTNGNFNLIPTQPITVHVTVTALMHIRHAGPGYMVAPVLAADQFSATVSGAGDLDIEGLNAASLEASLEGLGDIHIASGVVGTQTISISGHGEYEAREVVSVEADVDIPGFGLVAVQVSDRLDVIIDGTGFVQYFGLPVVTQAITRIGRVDPLGVPPVDPPVMAARLETFDTVGEGVTDFTGASGAQIAGGIVQAVENPVLAHSGEFAYRVEGTVTVRLAKPADRITVFVVGANWNRISLSVAGSRGTTNMSSIGIGSFTVLGDGENGVGQIHTLTLRSDDGWIDSVAWREAN